jgi:hypothetical protein
MMRFVAQSVEFWTDGEPGRDRDLVNVNCVVECNTLLVIENSAQPGHEGSFAHVRLGIARSHHGSTSFSTVTPLTDSRPARPLALMR